MKEKTFYTELAYIFGIILVAIGVALMEKSDFGVSMIVAPAYLLYRWLNPMWSVFTFGMAEYCFQALLLAVMGLILRRFRLAWFFSFVTAVIYGFVLDGCMMVTAVLPDTEIWQRALLYVFGLIFCAAGVSMMFHTYISPEVYELFVKEVSATIGVDINRFKTVYDCVSCAVGVLMSFLIFGFGSFVGVRAGTILCALVNGWTIGRFSALYEKLWVFQDRLPWRGFFTGEGKD